MKSLTLFFALCAAFPLEAETAAHFNADRAAGQAEGIMEFAEAGRCYEMALASADNDAEKSQALASIAGMKMNQGDFKGIESLLQQACDRAQRGHDGPALAWALTQAAEYALKNRRLADADAANQRALNIAARTPFLSFERRDRLYFQRAEIMAARYGAPKAAAFLGQSWESWAFRPDYLYGLSREGLARAVLAYLDLRRVDKAFVFAAIYADRCGLAPNPCPEALLRCELGAARVCEKYGRAKAARVFYEKAAERMARLFNGADEGACRARRLARSLGRKGAS